MCFCNQQKQYSFCKKIKSLQPEFMWSIRAVIPNSDYKLLIPDSKKTPIESLPSESDHLLLQYKDLVT